MNMIWTGARFELRCATNQSYMPKAAGMHFDYQKKCWWTGRTDVAKKFEMHADPAARKRFSQEQEQIEMSKAVDSNIEIPVPEGLSYLPFQKGGIAFAIPRLNTLIADEMGLGKTIQAIGIINAFPEIKRVLVICPASLRLNWARELQKWCVLKLTGGFAVSGMFPDTNIVIMSYEQVNKFREQIDKVDWDLEICDEAHYLKTPDAQRTKAVLGAEYQGKQVKLPISARKRLFLTGTPILNKPIELWPILRIIDPEGLGSNHWAFAKRYCAAWDAPWGWDFSGSSNLDELQSKLRSKVMVRRLKKDVLKELPPKRRQIIAIPGDKLKKVIDAELTFYDSNIKVVEEAKREAEVAQAAGDEATYMIATKRLKETQQVMFEQISKLRHDTAVAKVPYVIEYVDEVLQQEDKIVLFAHHHDVMRPLYEKYRDIAVQFHGQMNMLERQIAVDRFQSDPKVKIFIGSLTAAGVGITLTAASYVLFAELDWVPANITQAEDRLHRIGQLESVLVQHLVFDQSLDARMAKKIIEKQEMIRQALDESPVEGEVIIAPPEN